MIESFFFNTQNDNYYLHDDQHRLSMLVHPELIKAYKGSSEVKMYYSKKLDYLKDRGFFANPTCAIFGTVDDSMIKESIIQTQQIIFETVDYCNLNCTYCGFGEYYEGYDERTGKKMDIHQATKLLNYIFEHKPKNKKSKLSIGFYGGEPLLNIEFIKKIVEVTSKLNAEKGLEIQYSMTTNATLLHKYIDFIVNNKFNLHISLDGNEKGQSYRVFAKNNKNSFQKVIKNVDIIQKNYPEYFSDCVNFIAVLHNRNSVKDIYEFIYSRYQKIPMISEINMNEIRPEKKKLLEGMYNSKYKSEIEFQNDQSNLLNTVHNEFNIFHESKDFLKYYSINYYVSNILSLIHNNEIYFPASTCLPFSKRVYHTVHHKLLPCEKINYIYSIGNVNENVEINVPEITRRYNVYYNHLKKICQYCYEYRFCGICIFQFDNIARCESEELVCENFKDQETFKNKMFRIFSFLEKYPKDFFHIIENVVIE